MKEQDGKDLKIIDQQTLDALSREAAGAPRLRKNLNMHDDYADPCQRLFNAMEPGTYIRPHRHTEPAKPECFLAVRGRMILITFTDDGKVEQLLPFGEGCDTVAIEVPAGVWHAVLSLQPGSIFFETKPGPYVALSDKDFAPWAPPEGSADVDAYMSLLLEQLHTDCS